LIPENIISATFSQEYTALEPIDVKNLTLGYKKVSKQSFRTNFLGLCAFSLILGFVVQSLESEAKIIKKTLKEINDIIMKIIMALMK
jgi:Na+/H+-dicarboxylate symporter